MAESSTPAGGGRRDRSTLAAIGLDYPAAVTSAPGPTASGDRTAAATVDLWSLDLNDFAADDARILEAEELARAGRFVFEHDRRRFMAARSGLRRILGGYTATPPESLRFRYGLNGKPALAVNPPIQFNLAHSLDLAMVAVCDCQVGVDVEMMRPLSDVGALAGIAFSPAEQDELRGAADPVRAFLHGWTRKEAYTKALGLGLSAPLQDITIALIGSPVLIAAGVPDVDPAEWSLADASSGSVVAAVAVNAPRLVLKRMGLAQAAR